MGKYKEPVTDVYTSGTGSGMLIKRPRSPGSTSPTPPPESEPLPISRRGRAKALAQVKRKRLEAVSEPDEHVSDSPLPGWASRLGLHGSLLDKIAQSGCWLRLEFNCICT